MFFSLFLPTSKALLHTNLYTHLRLYCLLLKRLV